MEPEAKKEEPMNPPEESEPEIFEQTKPASPPSPHDQRTDGIAERKEENPPERSEPETTQRTTAASPAPPHDQRPEQVTDQPDEDGPPGSEPDDHERAGPASMTRTPAPGKEEAASQPDPWDAIQRQFVEDPEGALRLAAEQVREVVQQVHERHERLREAVERAGDTENRRIALLAHRRFAADPMGDLDEW